MIWQGVLQCKLLDLPKDTLSRHIKTLAQKFDCRVILCHGEAIAA